METPRWWHVAVAIAAVVLAGMVLSADVAEWRKVGAVASLAVFVIGWFAVGRLAFENRVAALVFTGIVIVTVGFAVSFYPLMAILQCIAYPLVWVITEGLRESLVANALLGTAVGVGFYFGTHDVLQTIVTVILSLGISIALGLWITSIADRSHERQRLLDELRDAQDKLATVNRDAGISSERERLAREIHDTIAQDLTGLVMLTQRARRELAGGHPESVDEQLALIEENARTALAETRALVAASAPVGLMPGDLRDALDRLAQRFERESGVAVTVQADPIALDRDTEVVLLRVAQEGLANVRKHSGATSAVIALDVTEGSARLEVRDDGGGFDAGAASGGFGLSGMRERLALVAGALDVTSSPSGTVLVATLPVNA